MALNFPDSPTLNQVYSAGGKTWSYNGSRWVLVIATAIIDVADGSITAAKIADGTIVAAEIANSAITTAKINNNAVTQAKLASNLSAVTVTTTANRDTDIPSPFTGQLIVLTDTKKVQLWDGTAWLNITMAPPETPTSLSAIASPTSVAISFTAGSANGSSITNYKYALSTDGGSTYGSFIALDPADFTTPITVSGLSMNTTYHVKLKAVNDLGDSAASAAVSFTTEGVPAAPTSLSASNITGSSVDIAFTAGAANGASITNYKFAVSTDDITYGAYSALDPADASTPITVTGLTSGTFQYIKLKAVNSNGDSAASAAVSLTTLATPGAPTSLSTGSITATSVAISFTPGDQGGSAITNYQYALSTNGGSTYGSFTALDPADATSPITVTGLTANTSYYIKLKAVNSAGAGTESSAVSLTTNGSPTTVDYLVVAGGGGGGGVAVNSTGAGGGGAGGFRTATGFAVSSGSTYTITVGGGGAGAYQGSNGGNSVFSTITSAGGGGGGFNANSDGQGGGNGSAGGSGGGGGSGGAGGTNGSGGAGNTPSTSPSQGNNGTGNGAGFQGGGGGGASSAGSGTTGGSGTSNAYSGASVTYATGGGGAGFNGFQGATGASNTGNGGGGSSGSATGASGGSGIVIIRYSDAFALATSTTGSPVITTTGGYNIYKFTGSGSITF